MWTDIITLAITAVISLVVLFALCKLMGNKQISQLSMFDYIVGISIGSIAAEMATELEMPLYPAIAMALYALAAFSISVWTSRSLSARKLFIGRPLLLMDAGVIYRENMKKARFDLSDFLTLCRINGYFNVSELQTAILEENGTVSFLPKSETRPLCPRDMAQYPVQEHLCVNVVLDGVVLVRSLAAMGRDAAWLDAQLQSLGYQSAKEVYLATLDAEGKLSPFPMTKEKRAFSPFD